MLHAHIACFLSRVPSRTGLLGLDRLSHYSLDSDFCIFKISVQIFPSSSGLSAVLCTCSLHISWGLSKTLLCRGVDSLRSTSFVRRSAYSPKCPYDFWRERVCHLYCEITLETLWNLVARIAKSWFCFSWIYHLNISSFLQVTWDELSSSRGICCNNLWWTSLRKLVRVSCSVKAYEEGQPWGCFSTKFRSQKHVHH